MNLKRTRTLLMTRKFTILVCGWSISVDKDESFAEDTVKDFGKELLKKLTNKLSKKTLYHRFTYSLLLFFLLQRNIIYLNIFSSFGMKNLE